MDQLPSKSLSKSILIATPLFCIVLALLDSSDDLSYLFVLQFLGNVAGNADLMFIPTLQPQIKSPNFQKAQTLKAYGVNDSRLNIQMRPLPILQLQKIQKWANQHSIIQGVSPRWLVPIEIWKTDALLLITNISKQLSIGVGGRSNVKKLRERQIALSQQLLRKLQVNVGDKLLIKVSISNMLKGSKLIEKYQSFQSREEYVVDNQQLNIDQISNYLYKYISSQTNQYNITITQQNVREIVKSIYDAQFSLNYTIAYQYKNNGLYTSSFHNVVLMQFEGFAYFLEEFITEKIIKNKEIQKQIFEQLQTNSDIPKAQLVLLRTYVRTARNTNIYASQIKQGILKLLYNYPLIAITTFKSRELIYHPNQMRLGDMLLALQSTPGDFQVISIYPFYKDLEAIRFFFKSVIQIFSFICAVIYFYIMRLILKQIYQEKQIEVGIWRTLGAGGVKQKQYNQNNYQVNKQIKQLNQRLTLKQKLRYGYAMLVKVGFLYYWLVSAFISTILFILFKMIIYQSICDFLQHGTPPQQWKYPIILFFLIIGFTLSLVIYHIRQIYVNPLVSTIKPVKRTFDLVKVRIIKIATFGITIQTLIIAIMLIYYGVVSYYQIPMSILYNDGWLQTILFNSIFLFMIFGAIILLSVMQSRMECFILQGFFRASQRLNNMKLIILKTIKAKQYKNIKVSIVIAIIFAFLLFFASGLRIEITIVQSFIERQLGADLVLQNYEKITFNRPEIEKYMNTIKGLKYSWFSNDLDNKKMAITFQGIVSDKPVKALFKIVTSNYLDTTYYQYYYPESYIESDKSSYQQLPNSIYNGFSSIYNKDTGKSIGRFDPLDTITEFDHNSINLNYQEYHFANKTVTMAPRQQVIDIVVTSTLRKKLGVVPGDFYKLNIRNIQTGKSYLLRCRINHSFKIGPGIDLFSSIAFFSEEQAKYIYQTVGLQLEEIKYEKLFITGSNLDSVGNKILSISPQHTQLFEMGLVKESFEIMSTYLQGFIALVTVILAVLSILFLFVYTFGKCKQEAEIFKMLRAIGLSVFDIRLMVFLQILIRIIVSIFNGIVLGIIFSLGLSGQIQQVLMINTPPINLTTILIIAVLMLLLFAVTVIKSTEYLTKRTVLQTSKA